MQNSINRSIDLTVRPLVSLLLLLALLAINPAQAEEIEFTYFYPNRHIKDRQATNTDWLLKTFPRDVGGTTDVERMDKSYGLIYVPGETVDVHLKNRSDVPIDKVTCTSELSGSALPVEHKGEGHWQVTIPERADHEAPYLHIYRVRAYAEGRVITEKGFAVTVPFSGMKAWKDPSLCSKKVSFLEWSNGSNPFHRMTNQHVRGKRIQETFPLKKRPYAYTDTGGLKDIYISIRRNSGEGDERPAPITSNEYYTDPSMEWNIWWHYYGQGASRYNGEWQWGPFAPMSAEQADLYTRTRGGNICYGDLRRYNSVLPNGVLWWQWSAYGLQKQMELEIPSGQRPVYNPVDGWSECIDYLNMRALDRTEEAGLLSLYYKYCQFYGKDLLWTKSYSTAKEFMDAQRKEASEPDKLNDYFHFFCMADVAAYNHAQLIHCTRKAFYKINGPEQPFYRGTFMNPYGFIDQFPFKYNGLDYRPRREAFTNVFQSLVRGGDYSHIRYIAELYGGAWSKARGYRGIGYRAAGQMALFPTLIWAHDSINYCRDYAEGESYTSGTPVPGNHVFDNAYGSEEHGGHLAFYKTIIDNGTSFRRFDMFERLPMYYDNQGKLCMREFTHCFGSFQGAYIAARNPLWNTQMLLGMQVMEIPDRLRPIGGVFVFDSNNAEDRAKGEEFVTQPGENFTPYVSLVLDQLGVVTFANGKTEKTIDPNIPRIYAPRRYQGKPCLTARVKGKTIAVPYTGPEMYTMENTEFRRFIEEVREAYTGGWPIQTTDGFVATAWHSSLGAFLYIENPMSAEGEIHVARQGTVKVRVDGLRADARVFDLCGGQQPDVRRLGLEEVNRNGDWLTITLDWKQGDTRLYWIY